MIEYFIILVFVILIVCSVSSVYSSYSSSDSQEEPDILPYNILHIDGKPFNPKNIGPDPVIELDFLPGRTPVFTLESGHMVFGRMIKERDMFKESESDKSKNKTRYTWRTMDGRLEYDERVDFYDDGTTAMIVKIDKNGNKKSSKLTDQERTLVLERMDMLPGFDWPESGDKDGDHFYCMKKYSTGERKYGSFNVSMLTTASKKKDEILEILDMK